MGYLDHLHAWFSRNGNSETGDAQTRSPRERALIAKLQGMLQDQAGDTAKRPSPVRWYLLFSGTVQGVGFRWTNQGIAGELGITGWVRNLPDGTVEMELQGAPAQLIRHLDSVHAYYDRMGCRMWLESERACVVIENEGAFNVRF